MIVSVKTPAGRMITPATLDTQETITVRLTAGQLAVVMDSLAWDDAPETLTLSHAWEEIAGAYLDITGRTAL